MRAVAGFLQVELGAAPNDGLLELDVLLEHLFERQGLRLTVDDGKVDDTECRLQLRILEQLVQNDLRVGVALQVDGNVHAVHGRVVVDVGNAFDAFFLDEVRDGLDEARFVDVIRDLGHFDLKAAVFLFDDLRFGADRELAAAGGVCRADAGAAHDHGARREVGARDVLHEFRQLDVRVIDDRAHTVDHFPHVVGRDVRRHTDGDAHGPVDQQVRIPGGQDGGLFQTVVIVRHEVDRVFVNVREHSLGDLAHAGLGVTVGSGRVAVDGTEVTVAVHQCVPHGEVLCKTDHSVIDGRVAVGVVPTQNGTDGVGALAVSLVGRQPVFVHGIENAAMDRFQSVTDVWQRTFHDDRHGVVEERFPHFVFQVDGNDLLRREVLAERLLPLLLHFG